MTNPNIVAVKALLLLDRIPDNQGNYPYIHVSFSEHDRIYIYKCPVVRDKFIVYEMKDLDPSFSHTRHMEAKSIKQYLLWCVKTILYVAITEKCTQYSTMKILYEQ